MTKVVWLGEGPDGPQEMKWAGRTFKVGEAVELDNPLFIAKAKNNRFFEIVGEGQSSPTAPLSGPKPLKKV